MAFLNFIFSRQPTNISEMAIQITKDIKQKELKEDRFIETEENQILKSIKEDLADLQEDISIAKKLHSQNDLNMLKHHINTTLDEIESREKKIQFAVKKIQQTFGNEMKQIRKEIKKDKKFSNEDLFKKLVKLSNIENTLKHEEIHLIKSLKNFKSDIEQSRELLDTFLKHKDQHSFQYLIESLKRFETFFIRIEKMLLEIEKKEKFSIRYKQELLHNIQHAA